MKKFCALLTAVMMLAFAGQALAHGYHRGGRWCYEEAGRRNITLISEAEAKRIAEERINERGVSFKEIELDGFGKLRTCREGETEHQH